MLPNEVIIEVTKRCNLDCDFCYNHDCSEKYEELSFEEIKTILDQSKKINANAVRITGGEPLLRKDIKEIISYAKSIGLNVILNTNGILIEKNLEAVKKCDLVLLSFHDVNHSKFLNNITKKLDEINIPFLISTILIKRNIEKIHDFYQKISEINSQYFKEWFFLRPVPRNEKDRPLSKSDIEKAFGEIRKNNKESGFDIKIANAIPFCSIDKPLHKICKGGKFDSGYTRIFIDSSGNIKPDYSSEQIFGNIKTKNLEEVWQTKFKEIREYKNIPEECKDCYHLFKCRSGLLEKEYLRDKTNVKPLVSIILTGKDLSLAEKVIHDLKNTNMKKTFFSILLVSNKEKLSKLKEDLNQINLHIFDPEEKIKKEKIKQVLGSIGKQIILINHYFDIIDYVKNIKGSTDICKLKSINQTRSSKKSSEKENDCLNYNFSFRNSELKKYTYKKEIQEARFLELITGFLEESSKNKCPEIKEIFIQRSDALEKRNKSSQRITEKSIIVYSYEDFRKKTEGKDRIYFGHEFCERLLPSKEKVKEVIKFSQEKNLGFSFITPIMTDKGMEKVNKIYEILGKEEEIIVNDLGLYNRIKDKKNIVVGRTLSRFFIMNLFKYKNNMESFDELLKIFSLKNKTLEVDDYNINEIFQTPMNQLQYNYYMLPPFLGIRRRCPFNLNITEMNKFAECSKNCLSSEAWVYNKSIGRKLYYKGNVILEKKSFVKEKNIPETFFKRIVVG